MFSIRKSLAIPAATLVLGLIGATAWADEQIYTEGPIVRVSGIHTEYGKFDEYMKYLDSSWKTLMEAEKKAGLILSYEVLSTDARSPDDPDLYLIVTYKNYAAFDGLRAKIEPITKDVFGSMAKASEGATERGKIRRAISSQTLQVLELK